MTSLIRELAQGADRKRSQTAIAVLQVKKISRNAPDHTAFFELILIDPHELKKNDV